MFSTAVTAQSPQGVLGERGARPPEGRKGQAVDVEDEGSSQGAWVEPGCRLVCVQSSPESQGTGWTWAVFQSGSGPGPAFSTSPRPLRGFSSAGSLVSNPFLPITP